MLPELIGSTKGGILSKFKCAAPPFVAHPREILLDSPPNIAALALQVSRLMVAVGVCECVPLQLCPRETILSPDSDFLASKRMTSSSYILCCFVWSFSYWLFVGLFPSGLKKNTTDPEGFPNYRIHVLHGSNTCVITIMVVTIVIICSSSCRSSSGICICNFYFYCVHVS